MANDDSLILYTDNVQVLSAWVKILCTDFE